MSKEKISESLHSIKHLKKGDLFLQTGKPCIEIGKLQKGVLRGFVYDNDGNELTTHFYQRNGNGRGHLGRKLLHNDPDLYSRQSGSNYHSLFDKYTGVEEHILQGQLEAPRVHSSPSLSILLI